MKKHIRIWNEIIEVLEKRDILAILIFLFMYYCQYVVLSTPDPTVNYIIPPPHYEMSLFFAQLLGTPRMSSIFLWFLIFRLIYTPKKDEQ